MQIFLNTSDSAQEQQQISIPRRNQVADQDKWNVKALYKNEKEWQNDFNKIDSTLNPILKLKNTLNSPQKLSELLNLSTKLDQLISKLYTYAQLRADEDATNTTNQARLATISTKNTQVGGELSWIIPEVLSNPEQTLQQWLTTPELKEHKYWLTRQINDKPHILSSKEEALLSKANEIFYAPNKAFSMLVDSDMKFPNIKDSNGVPQPLSQGRFITFLIDKDPQVRKNSYNTFYNTFKQYNNTLTATYSSSIKKDNYIAKIRNHPSALKAALHDDNIPTELYQNLIDSVHEALPSFYKYVKLRKKTLGLSEIGMHDIYVPIVPNYEIKVPYEQACEWILEACKPLGEDYIKILKTAFSDGWIDKYENQGKRSGAYSGGCYDSLPYILTNYQGTLNSVFTLAHELGHSMHSWLARHTQPAHTANYPIFIAEIPSTLNEALLLQYLLKTQTDSHFQAYLLNHLCDSYKGTVFRQTMFAEFEKIVHNMQDQNIPLTTKSLNELYLKLVKLYYGSEVNYDDKISVEWSRIPHFYGAYYVYKYATSFCASQLFLKRINQSTTNRDQFLNLLKAGGSDYPLPLIQKAGVSLLSKDTLKQAFNNFDHAIEKLSEILPTL